MSERDKTIDIARGIGITLMVIGHTYCPQVLCDFIYLFHMPLFFFLSGYLSLKLFEINLNYTVLKHKLKKLYLPYVSFSFVLLVLHNTLFDFHLEPVRYSTINIIIKAVELPLMMGTDSLIAGYWFLGSLFYIFMIAVVFNFFLNNIGRNIRIMIIVIMFFVLFEIIFYSRRLYPNMTPDLDFFSRWALTILSGGVMFMIGCLFKAFNVSPYFSKRYVALGIILLLLMTYLQPIYRPYDDVTLGVFVFLAGVIGTLTTLSISKYVTGIIANILSVFGEHTLLILSWHLIFFKLVPLPFVLFKLNSLNILSEYPVPYKLCANGGWIAFCFVGICTPLLCSYLYNRVKLSFTERND